MPATPEQELSQLRTDVTAVAHDIQNEVRALTAKATVTADDFTALITMSDRLLSAEIGKT